MWYFEWYRSGFRSRQGVLPYRCRQIKKNKKKEEKQKVD